MCAIVCSDTVHPACSKSSCTIASNTSAPAECVVASCTTSTELHAADGSGISSVAGSSTTGLGVGLATFVLWYCSVLYIYYHDFDFMFFSVKSGNCK